MSCILLLFVINVSIYLTQNAFNAIGIISDYNFSLKKFNEEIIEVKIVNEFLK